MGMWAFRHWDNDEAADWYGEVMDRTRLRDVWLKGISQAPNESPDTVRAASALFVMLGRVYIWPIKHFDEDLERTIAALTAVAECDEYKEITELKELIAIELDELKSRRKSSAASPTPSLAQSRPWWRFWP